MWRFTLLLFIGISAALAQDTLKTGTTETFRDSLIVTSKKEVPLNTKEPQKLPYKTMKNSNSASYKWTIETNSEKKYTSCWVWEIKDDSLVFAQIFNYKPVEFVSLHLDSIKIVRYDVLPRLLTGMGGGCLGCYPGFVIGLNISIAMTDTYENMEYVLPSVLGGIFAGRWALQKLFSKGYDLSELDTAEKRMKLLTIM